MSKDYRIKETIRANGESVWFVEHWKNNEWGCACPSKSKKAATKHIKVMRGLVEVGTQYHEVADG